MFSENLLTSLQATLAEIDSAGLFKRERLIDSPQDSTVRLKVGRPVINMRSHNSLLLAAQQEVLADQGLARKRSDGSAAYTAQIRIKSGGKVTHSEAQTFDRRALAVEWLRRRETELQQQRASGVVQHKSITLGELLQQYTQTQAHIP